jgi:hypothetical protein
VTENPSDDYDSPWKEALERYLPQFLALLFPSAHAGIDWSQGYEFLDKELQQVSIRNASDAIRRVNKRRHSGGAYLDDAELAEAIDEVMPSALRQASLETFEGRHDEAELAAPLTMDELKQDALSIISA